MGVLRDIFEEKVLLWEGGDEAMYEDYCKKLRDAGLKIQAFLKNQRKLRCNGDCASCPMAVAEGKAEQSSLEKFGNAYDSKTDIVDESNVQFALWDIYVKKSEVTKAREILGIQ